MIFKYSRIKTTKWNLFFHYASIGLSFISGVILVPLYLKFIPLKLYGAWLATGNILVWLTIIDPGISTVLMQQIGTAYGKNDKKSIQENIVGGSIITICIVVIIIVAAILAKSNITLWLNLSTEINIDILEKAFVIAAIGSSLMILSFTFVSINQGLQASLGIGIIFISVSIVRIVFIIFMLYNGYRLLSLAYGQLIMGAGLLFGNLIYLSRRIQKEKIGISFSLKSLWKICRLISFTFLSRIGQIFSNQIDLFVVTRFLGAEYAAILKMSKTAPDISRSFVERPGVALMPSLAHLMGSGETDKAKIILLRLIRLMFWLLGILLSGFIAMNDDFVRLWVGSHLFAGQTISLNICVGFFLLVISSIFGNLCFALGNIKGKSLAEFIQAILYIPLIILGTKYFGLIGCTIAPIIAIGLTTLWYYPYSFKELLCLKAFDIRHLFHELLCIIIVIMPITSFFYIITPKTWFSFFGMAVSFVVLYLIGLSAISKEFKQESYLLYRKFSKKIWKEVST